MAGLLDFLNPLKKMPEAPAPVQVDPQVQGLIDSGVDRSVRSPEEIAAETNQGVAVGAGQLGQSEQQAQNQGLRQGGDAGYINALRGAYSARSDQNIGRIVEKNQMQAQYKKSDQMAKMSRTALAQQRVQTQNFETLTQAYNQQEMARAQFINQIFQLGGTGMGMAAANRKAVKQDESIIGSGPTRTGGYAPSQVDYGGGAGDGFGNGGMEYA